MTSQFSWVRRDHGAAHMDTAPTDGTMIVAYVQNSLREVRVRWRGRFWEDSDDELWDTWQLVGWKPI